MGVVTVIAEKEESPSGLRAASHIPIAMQTTPPGPDQIPSRSQISLAVDGTFQNFRNTFLFFHVPGPDGPDEEAGEVVVGL